MQFPPAGHDDIPDPRDDHGKTADPFVRAWIEGEFRNRLRDDDFIKKHMPLLLVGRSMGDSHEETLRRFVISIVLDVAGIEPGKFGDHN